jgi:hypothetical protein
MKRKLLWVLAVIGLTLPLSTPPSHAIITACETLCCNGSVNPGTACKDRNGVWTTCGTWLPTHYCP